MEKKRQAAHEQGGPKKKGEKSVPKVVKSSKFIMADKKEAEKEAAKKK
jgi:hypothetical protein